MSGKAPKPDPKDDRYEQFLDKPWWLVREAEASVRLDRDPEGTQTMKEDK